MSTKQLKAHRTVHEAKIRKIDEELAARKQQGKKPNKTANYIRRLKRENQELMRKVVERHTTPRRLEDLFRKEP
jgi:hypothetical protein